MEIIATARLRYRDGESIVSGWEKLELVVKFKEEGKFLRTELVESLVSTYQIHHNPDPFSTYTYDDFITDCERYISNVNLIQRDAEKMVKDYFNEKYKDAANDNRSKDIQNKVHKLRKIEIKVKVN